VQDVRTDTVEVEGREPVELRQCEKIDEEARRRD